MCCLCGALLGTEVDSENKQNLCQEKVGCDFQTKIGHNCPLPKLRLFAFMTILASHALQIKILLYPYTMNHPYVILHSVGLLSCKYFLIVSLSFVNLSIQLVSLVVSFHTCLRDTFFLKQSFHSYFYYCLLPVLRRTPTSVELSLFDQP